MVAEGLKLGRVFAVYGRSKPGITRDNRTLVLDRAAGTGWSNAGVYAGQPMCPGGSRQTWETAPISNDADLIIIKGSWPLAPRGQ